MPLGRQDYLTAMIQTFEEAEELESLEDLHALCEMMRAFRTFLASHKLVRALKG